MMIIQLDQIKEHGISRQYQLSPHDFPDASAWEESGDFKLHEPVRVEVTLNRIGGLIEAKGRVATKVESTCGRCLKNFTFDLDEPFALTFTNEPLTVHDDGVDAEEGVELSAEELGLIPFVGESIDLSEALGEQFLLALPVRPLCSEECQGLCPYCGIDLNEKKCHCTPPDFANKFSSLKNLKLN
jgi:uncharacterized protein